MANRFWVGGTNTWNSTAGTKWSTTSGGGGGSAVPTSSDDVFFDAASGAVTVTITFGTAICKNITFTGFTGTLTGSGFDCYGSLLCVSGMTLSPDGINFKGTTAGLQITSAGKILSSNSNYVVFDGVGGEWTLQDDYTLGNNGSGGGGISLVNGKIDANNKNVLSTFFESNNSNTRSLVMGSGTWQLNGDAVHWNTTTTTGLTFNAGTSTIKITSSNSTQRLSNFGGLTINNYWNATTGSGLVGISGSSIFNNIKIDAGRTQLFTAGTTQTVTTFTATGTAGNLITITSSASSTSTHTLSCASGIISCDYLDVSHSVATGGATWNAGAHSTNNNGIATAGSGWIFGGATGNMFLAI